MKKIVEVVKKIHTSYVAIDSRSHKTSDEDPNKTSDQISVDKRHYCTHCKRKRDERYMHTCGWGAYGKKQWRCIDDTKACLAIRKLKRGY